MRNRLLLPALLGVLALLIAACPEDGPAIVEDPDDAAVEDETGVGLDTSCTNDAVGYTVEHPGDWVVNEGDGLPACSAFDPESVDIPDATEIPFEIAVVIREARIGIGTAADIDGAEELSREETTVDGRDAVIVEAEGTGDFFFPEGLTFTRYHVDLGHTTLIGVTFDVDDADLTYEERRDVLAAMMASLEFSDGDQQTGDEADEPADGTADDDGDDTDDGDDDA